MRTPSERPPRAVVLAGGRGRRLEPFTAVLPKPLAPVGERPIIDILLRQLARDGFGDVVVSLGYLGELIEAYLRERPTHGAAVAFVRERSPLGTAGALSLVDAGGGDLLAVNGDLLTNLCFGELVATHRRAGAALTIAVGRRRLHVDFGVVEADGDVLTAFREKPDIDLDCSIGANVYGPRALAEVSRLGRCDLPDVVDALVAAGERVTVHRFDGYWLDIGSPEDHARAQHELAEVAPPLLPPEAAR